MVLDKRPRATDLGLKIGILPSGRNNTITDVPDVSVGHVTLNYVDGPLVVGQGPVRTGVTVVLPCSGNIFEKKVTGAFHIINGFGKAIGFPQVMELGVIESPIALTGTLSTWRVADGLIDYLASRNSGVQSFNPIVGECNDGFLNDIVGRHVGPQHVLEAIERAVSPNVEEGNVGAGTGMTAFGWKGGIGTSSRICNSSGKEFVVGALSLTNTGDPRELRVNGLQIGEHMLPPRGKSIDDGSIMIIVATNAPVTSRQLGRLARRAVFGLGRIGGIASHGSGDFVIAFSNYQGNEFIDDDDITNLFRGVVESTEESILNSILRAETTIGRDGNVRHEIDIDKLKGLINER
jgi:D-aminopeptidase